MAKILLCEPFSKGLSPVSRSLVDWFKDAGHQLVSEHKADKVLELLSSNEVAVAIFYTSGLDCWDLVERFGDINKGKTAAPVVIAEARRRGSKVPVIAMERWNRPFPPEVVDVVAKDETRPEVLIDYVNELLQRS